MKYRLILVIFSLIFCVSCYEEDPLVPTETPESKYTLPQGDHDYDTKILDWHERCGFYILYKFEPKDVYWDINEWNLAKEKDPDHGTWSGFKIEPAHEDYAGNLLDVVERNFLNFYPDTMLRRCMPMKLLLCSEITEYWYEDVYFGVDYMEGFDLFAVNHGNEEILSMPADEIDYWKNEMNKAFLYRLTTNKKIAMSSDFLSFSSYDEGKVSKQEMYARGYIRAPWSSDGKDKKEDWEEFLEAIIDHPLADLEAEPEDGDYSFKGILHEKKDVRGKIRNKYNTLIRYFKDEYGVDLQKIRDSREPTGE